MIQVPSKDFWQLFKNVRGAFSCTEAVALYNIALQVRYGLYIELGTHKGKSTLAAALGLPAGEFILVEPEFVDEKWSNEVFETVAPIAGNKLFLRLVADESLNVIEKHKAFSFAFVDSGTHSDDLVMNECKLLEDKMISGGIIAFHDFKNQFVRVEEAYNYLVSTGKYLKVEIQWQPIIEYVRLNELEKDNNSWHQYDDNPFPNFVGALVKK